MEISEIIAKTFEDLIKAEAYRLGFSLCGITSAETPANFELFTKWIENRFNAGSTYLETERHRNFRRDPSLLMPGVKTIICLGFPYPLYPLQDYPRDSGWIAGYVMEEDYHTQIPLIAEKLLDFIRNFSGEKINATFYTDSAPILERELAVRSGLGWIGRNSNFISPTQGSNVLLAEIFLDIPLNYDTPFTKDLCGSCQRCIQACPTGCIQSNRTIDSRSCISYLTIEDKTIAVPDLRPKIGNWVFGCDICQQVCPWNHKSQKKTINKNPSTISIDEMISILKMDQIQFQNRYGETSLARSKLPGIQKNVLIVLGNLGQKKMIPEIQNTLNTSEDPEIIEASTWAIEQLTTDKK
jgi:epoxyqueuosine reductase